jgi:hypothetical protein
VCPTCKATDWIVNLPIVEEYTFDSESGRIVLDRTDDTPQPLFRRVICAPPDSKSDHFPTNKTQKVVEKAVSGVLADPAGKLSYDPQVNQEVAPANYKQSIIFKCPQCYGSKWLVHTPNEYSWLFNSNLGNLELKDGRHPHGIFITYDDAKCIGCDRLAEYKELAQIAKSFGEAYVRVRYPNNNFVVALAEDIDYKTKAKRLSTGIFPSRNAEQS